MKTSFTLLTLVAATLLLASSGMVRSQDWKDEEVARHSYAPSKGYVPDEATAIVIAEAILAPIYGKEAIEKQKPFHVSLEKDLWTVSGRLNQRPDRLILGGVFRIQISRQDASVKSLTHGK